MPMQIQFNTATRQILGKERGRNYDVKVTITDDIMLDDRLRDIYNILRQSVLGT